jgi:predicted enzyme involved in methoxymalonyl-ACP biosynthesis
MFDTLIEQCQLRCLRRIVGIYIATKKNGMVADHYSKLGFNAIGSLFDNQTFWSFEIPAVYVAKSRHISRVENSDLGGSEQSGTGTIICSVKAPETLGA